MPDLKPQSDLVRFARQYGPQNYDYQHAILEPLCGDAGFRRYYRLTSKPSLMMADSPPDKERNFDMVRVSDLLARTGVRIPEIHAVDFELGTFVIEDLGPRLFQDTVLSSPASDAYTKALDLLYLMQTEVARPEWMEDYSATFLREEMNLFLEWFLQELLGVTPTDDLSNLIETLFQRLIDSALEQPQTFVHRDFHCRNLMMIRGQGSDPGHPVDGPFDTSENVPEEVAAIDFQDAVWGPITYDLVSIARDCYLRWEQSEVDQLVEAYSHRLTGLTADQLEKFPKWFDFMGLQRHIKVLGVFARLAIRDNKKSYLNDLPLVLRYTIECLATYPEFSELHQYFLNEIIPLASKQSWYSDWQTAGKSLNQSLHFV